MLVHRHNGSVLTKSGISSNLGITLKFKIVTRIHCIPQSSMYSGYIGLVLDWSGHYVD